MKASGGKPKGSQSASTQAQAELLAKLGGAFEELDGRHLAMKLSDATFNQLGLSPFDSSKGDFLAVDPATTRLEIVSHGRGGDLQYEPVKSLDQLNVGSDFVAFLHRDEEVHCRVLARLGYMSNETTLGIGDQVLPGMQVRSVLFRLHECSQLSCRCVCAGPVGEERHRATAAALACATQTAHARVRCCDECDGTHRHILLDGAVKRQVQLLRHPHRPA